MIAFNVLFFYNEYIIKPRGREVVSHEAHNLETSVQFRPPQQYFARVAQLVRAWHS